MDESPILTPGLHDINESDLQNHFLSAFPGSLTRASLINGLTQFIARLKQVGIPVELWVDGSFTTRKENPNDVDLVVFASEADVNGLSAPHQTQLAGLLDRVSTRHKYGCDVLFSVKEDQDMRSYWRGWYGFDRNENPKGIARLMVNI